MSKRAEINADIRHSAAFLPSSTTASEKTNIGQIHMFAQGDGSCNLQALYCTAFLIRTCTPLSTLYLSSGSGYARSWGSLTALPIMALEGAEKWVIKFKQRSPSQ